MILDIFIAQIYNIYIIILIRIHKNQRLLAIRITTSCFAFTSCEDNKKVECIDPITEHYFTDGVCRWCGHTYCEVNDHTFDEDGSPCSQCGTENPDKEAIENKAEVEKALFWAEEAFWGGLVFLVIGLIVHAVVGHASGVFYWLPLLVFLVFVIIQYNNSILNGIIATIYFVLYIFGRLFINSKIYD